MELGKPAIDARGDPSALSSGLPAGFFDQAWSVMAGKAWRAVRPFRFLRLRDCCGPSQPCEDAILRLSVVEPSPKTRPWRILTATMLTSVPRPVLSIVAFACKCHRSLHRLLQNLAATRMSSFSVAEPSPCFAREAHTYPDGMHLFISALDQKVPHSIPRRRECRA